MMVEVVGDIFIQSIWFGLSRGSRKTLRILLSLSKAKSCRIGGDLHLDWLLNVHRTESPNSLLKVLHGILKNV